MSKPLTDGINALITYANGVTGHSDQTLSDAVATLANGYGGGGGGASNFVTGTFTTGSSTSTVGSVTVPYTGSGYPVMLVIVVEGGIYNPNITGWYNSLTRYAVGVFTICKSNESQLPTYSTTGDNNAGTVTFVYKNSASSSTSYTGSAYRSSNSYSSSSANGTVSTCVRWKGNGTTISYKTGGGTNTSYGLLADTTYRYYAVYSE